MESQVPTPPEVPNVQYGIVQKPESAGGFAIAAFVLSLVGLVCCTVVPSIVSLVFAIIERGRIKRGESSTKGKGFVTAAIIIDSIAIPVIVIAIILYVVFIVVYGFESEYNYST